MSEEVQRKRRLSERDGEEGEGEDDGVVGPLPVEHEAGDEKAVKKIKRAL